MQTMTNSRYHGFTVEQTKRMYETNVEAARVHLALLQRVGEMMTDPAFDTPGARDALSEEAGRQSQACTVYNDAAASISSWLIRNGHWTEEDEEGES
jgi:hypothetical protein